MPEGDFKESSLKSIIIDKIESVDERINRLKEAIKN